jgi:hypothetical protein
LLHKSKSTSATLSDLSIKNETYDTRSLEIKGDVNDVKNQNEATSFTVHNNIESLAESIKELDLESDSANNVNRLKSSETKVKKKKNSLHKLLFRKRSRKNSIRSSTKLKTHKISNAHLNE